MPITPLREDIDDMYRAARHQVRDCGHVLYYTASFLEARGIDVGALERRLLDNVEAA